MAANDLITLAKVQSTLTDRGGVRRPWEYPLAAAIPHYETPETLPVLLELLRLQTVRPYILLIDTGSWWKTVRELERLRAPDCEVHYLRARAYRHTSPTSAVRGVKHNNSSGFPRVGPKSWHYILLPLTHACGQLQTLRQLQSQVA